MVLWKKDFLCLDMAAVWVYITYVWIACARDGLWWMLQMRCSKFDKTTINPIKNGIAYKCIFGFLQERMFWALVFSLQAD